MARASSSLQLTAMRVSRNKTVYEPPLKIDGARLTLDRELLAKLVVLQRVHFDSFPQ
jgi:hypothetical protein